MDEVWRRVEQELAARKRGPAWLARKLDCSVQRIVNWRVRGVPAGAYPELAAVLGWSLDRLVGTDGAPTPGSMSPMAQKLAEQFDEIEDDAAQLQAFVRCVAIIARAADGPVEQPTEQPARKPTIERRPSE